MLVVLANSFANRNRIFATVKGQVIVIRLKKKPNNVFIKGLIIIADSYLKINLKKNRLR